jgi:proline dehydrogenase
LGLLNEAIARSLPILPRGLVRLVARRYVAGETLDDALRVVAALNAEGATATVDILGENTRDAAAAARTRDAYVELLEGLHARGLDSNISVKLTALGVGTDAQECHAHVARICEEARRRGNFVRIDMEDSAWTQATLDMYERLRHEHANVGPVLQAYLRRTISDARALASHRANVRLCKGIYVEPHAVAWQDREVVRLNFAWILRELLAGGCHVGIATHDELLVWEALRLVDELRTPRQGYEFQMLLGVLPELRRLLLASGHRLRVYVPYGTHWYEYSLRRLKENPEIAGHVLRAMLRRG